MAAPRSSGYPFAKPPAAAAAAPKKPAAAVAVAAVAEAKAAPAPVSSHSSSSASAEPVHAEDTVMAPESFAIASNSAGPSEPPKAAKPKAPRAKRVTTAGASCLDADKLSAYLKTLSDADRKKYGLKVVADFAVANEAVGMSQLASFNRVCQIAAECGVKAPKADSLDFSKVPKQAEHVASAYMYFCNLNPVVAEGESKVGVTELSKIHGAKWSALRAKAASGDAAAVAEIEKYQKLADEGKEAIKARANDTPLFSEAALKHCGLPFAVAEPEKKAAKKRKAASDDETDAEAAPASDEPKKKKAAVKKEPVVEGLAALVQLLGAVGSKAPKPRKPAKANADDDKPKPSKKKASKDEEDTDKPKPSKKKASKAAAADDE